MKILNKYIVVVNPISGSKDKTDLIEQIKSFSEKSNIDSFIYETTGTNDKSELSKIYKSHKPERVIVAGGDGTLKMVVEALENEDVIYGLIPAGSANGFATDLNIPNTMEDILNVAFHNDFSEIDVVEINGMKSLHLSDLGLNALLVKNYENSDSRGKLGYLQQVIPTLKEAEEVFKASIKTEDSHFECEAKMIVIANSQKYGTGIVINPIGKLNDGKFEIVVLKSLDFLVIAKIISGNIPISDDTIEVISASKAEIALKQSVNFQIDGEYFGTIDNLKVDILKGKIKIATP